MYLAKKTILLISPEPWSHLFVSKHHYARHLAARGNEVIFVNPASDKWQISHTDIQGLRVLDYPKFVRGLRLFPTCLSQRLILKKFRQIQKYCDLTFDIIWSFDNSVFFDFDALPNNILTISHIVDLNQDFETAKAASTADICFGTTRYIIERLKQHINNTHFINHGFNDLFDGKEIKLPGKGKIKILYAGNLSMPYLDWDTIYKVVEANNDLDFVFAGPGVENLSNESKMMCYDASNTYFIGKVSSAELHNWYAQADLLLISYQEKYRKDQSNPHKMMEYLGSGTVVVATNTEEYQHLSDGELIAMSNRNTELPDLFSSVIKNLDKWNSKEKSRQRIAYAHDNTYEKQIERIEKLLASNDE